MSFGGEFTPFEPFKNRLEDKNTESLIKSRDAQAALTLQSIQSAMDEARREKEFVKRSAPKPPPVPGQPADPAAAQKGPSASDMILGEIGKLDKDLAIAADLALPKKVEALTKLRESAMGRYSLAVEREGQASTRVDARNKARIDAVSKFASGANALFMDEALAVEDKTLQLQEMEAAIRLEHPEAYKVLSQGQDGINWGDKRTWARMKALEQQAIAPEKRVELQLSKLSKEAQAARDEAAARRSDAMVAAMREGNRKAEAPSPVTIRNPDGEGNILIDAKTGKKIGDAPARPRDEEAVLAKQVTQLSKGLEQAKLPETNAVLENAENIIKKDPKVLKYLTGTGSVPPDWMVSKGAREARQAVEKVFNVELKNRSGAAVTNQELERLKSEYGKGAFKTPDQLQAALAQARQIINTHYRSVAAGFPKEALETYNANLTAIGGKPVIDIAGTEKPAAAAGAPAPYSDAEKERRYQEWKAANKK